MNRRELLKGLVSLFIPISVSAKEGFDEFYKQRGREFSSYSSSEQKAFQEYLKELRKEFEEYLHIYWEEFKNYQREISKVWEKPEFTTRKTWVSYSSDLLCKKKVDYEKGKIVISVIAVSEEKAKNRLEEEVKNLLTETKDVAFQKDKFLQRVERRVSKLKLSKSSTLDAEPVVSDVFFPKKPKVQEVNNFSKRLIKQSKLTVSTSKKGKVYTLTFSFPKGAIFRKAKKCKPVVLQFSRKYQVDPALVFAIIHTESSFNPFARSPVPAYGLMQIVPQTAGKDASRMVYGKPLLLTPSFLYNRKNNVMIGCAYLNLLWYHYLRDVNNPESRLYCTVAAYNGGIGRILKTLAGTTKIGRAAKKINSLSPQEVYRTLRTATPAETREYLKKVCERRKYYLTFISEV